MPLTPADKFSLALEQESLEDALAALNPWVDDVVDNSDPQTLQDMANSILQHLRVNEISATQSFAICLLVAQHIYTEQFAPHLNSLYGTTNPERTP